MKKLLLLFLLVAGNVMNVDAFTDAIYFMSNANGWSKENHKFTRINESKFVTELTADEITYLKSNSIRFKFVVTDWSCDVGSANTSDANVSTTKYSSSNGAKDAGCLVIPSNSNAKKVQIRLNYTGSTWNITACVFETTDTYTITFDKSLHTTSSGWTNLYCYSYINDHELVTWTETGMSANGNLYSCSIPKNAAHIIFNNGGTGNENQSYDITDIVNNGVYKFDGLYGISTTVSSASYATFVSPYALDYTSKSIKAYTASVNTTTGQVTLTNINKVPANTPVVLYKAGGATETIPVATSTDSPGANNLVAGTGAAVSTTDGAGNYNYILNNVDDVIGFYKAAGNTVAPNRAYLHTTYNVAAGSSSRMSIVFADETTGINNLTPVLNDGAFYDLQGRRVAQPTKGLYIINGKKVIR